MTVLQGQAEADAAFMAAALSLAARTIGDCAPNPAVGCVLVKDGVVVGRGWTQSGGRPHAETQALAQAGAAARGATAYVTLEPCSTWGRTPPCTEAILAAGVRRVRPDDVAQPDAGGRRAAPGRRRRPPAGRCAAACPHAGQNARTPRKTGRRENNCR